MILPLQKNLFLPGKTSHFLLGAVFFFLWGDSMGDEELCVLIWLYSQSFMGPLPPPGVIKRKSTVGRAPPERSCGVCRAGRAAAGRGSPASRRAGAAPGRARRAPRSPQPACWQRRAGGSRPSPARRRARKGERKKKLKIIIITKSGGL